MDVHNYAYIARKAFYGGCRAARWGPQGVPRCSVRAEALAVEVC